MEEAPAIDCRDEHIVTAVVVVIGDRRAEAVEIDRIEPAAREDVLEGPVVIVSIESVLRPLTCPPVLSIHEQQVWPSVRIDIEHDHATAEQLGIPDISGCCTVVVHERDTRPCGDVCKCDRWRRLNLNGVQRDGDKTHRTEDGCDRMSNSGH